MRCSLISQRKKLLDDNHILIMADKSIFYSSGELISIEIIDGMMTWCEEHLGINYKY